MITISVGALCITHNVYERHELRIALSYRREAVISRVILIVVKHILTVVEGVAQPVLSG